MPPDLRRTHPGTAAAVLVLTMGTVGKHIASMFGKLALPACQTGDRRVLAVLHPEWVEFRHG